MNSAARRARTSATLSGRAWIRSWPLNQAQRQPKTRRGDYLRLSRFLTWFRGTSAGSEAIFVKSERGCSVSCWRPVSWQRSTSRAPPACSKAIWVCFNYASSSGWSEVSDKMAGRPFLGDFQNPREEPERLYRHPGKRRLVEECQVVLVYAVQRAFGKRPLIVAIRQARPFRLPVPGGCARKSAQVQILLPRPFFSIN